MPAVVCLNKLGGEEVLPDGQTMQSSNGRKWEETTHSDDCRREIDESDDSQNLDCRSIFGAFLLHNI